jgi:hypothetical protein
LKYGVAAALEQDTVVKVVGATWPVAVHFQDIMVEKRYEDQTGSLTQDAYIVSV